MRDEAITKTKRAAAALRSRKEAERTVVERLRRKTSTEPNTLVWWRSRLAKEPAASKGRRSSRLALELVELPPHEAADPIGLSPYRRRVVREGRV